ncbi:MAG: hypothetical protein AAGC57_20205 [Pseudomonadota bacterium]
MARAVLQRCPGFQARFKGDFEAYLKTVEKKAARDGFQHNARNTHFVHKQFASVVLYDQQAKKNVLAISMNIETAHMDCKEASRMAKRWFS